MKTDLHSNIFKLIQVVRFKRIKRIANLHSNIFKLIHNIVRKGAIRANKFTF